MYKQVAAVFLSGACASLARADIVELSPNLYLVVRTAKFDNGAKMKIAAINEANQFAASTNRVAVPVSGQLVHLGSLLKEYDYQFRVMERAAALAVKPVLADVVVALNDANACGEPAAPKVAALLPQLGVLDAFKDRGLPGVGDPARTKIEEEEAPAPAPSAVPSAQ